MFRRASRNGTRFPSVENGKYDPSLPLAFGIARLFELQIEAIFDTDHSETAEIA